MDATTHELIDAYINACSGKDWPALVKLLDPNATLGGTVNVECNGVDEYVRGFRNLAPIFEKYRVRKVIVEGNDAAILYDFVTNTSVDEVLTAEFLTTNASQITSSTLLFDLRRWPEVQQELARRTP
jgi:hypothetical protein